MPETMIDDPAHPVLSRPVPNALVPSSYGRRLVVFDPTTHPAAHAGRATMRRTVLAMTPEDPQSGPRLRAVPGEADTGVFWGMLAPNGLAVVLRTRDFTTADDARRDGDQLLTRAGDLKPHSVIVPGTGLRSMWVTLDGRVVLVAGQVWRRSGPRVETHLMRASRQGAQWGPLDA